MYFVLGGGGWEAISVNPVTTEDVLRAVAHTKPSGHGMAAKYSQWQAQYESS